MATMWLTTFSVALFALAEVGSYPSYQAPTSLADLPIDCPFHKEPIGVDHIGDTAYGTLTQTGNYEFSKIPGNLVESGQDYAGYAQNNPLTSQAQQVYPGYQQGYQQPQSYPQEYPYGYEPQQFPGYNQYQTQQFPEYNQYQTQQFPEYNQYQTEEGYASVLPYYGEPENYYGNDNSYNQQQGDNFMSIQPYYGDQTPEQNVQYEFVEQPQDQLYQNNEIVEAQYVNPEQENDFTHVVEVIDNCKSNLNAIYEGACEEITEAEETAAARIEKARARVNSQSFEDFALESYSGEQGFTRSLFSLFKPQNLISMPMKAVNTGVDAFVLSPLQAFSKAPAKKIPEPVIKQNAPVNFQQTVQAAKKIPEPVIKQNTPVNFQQTVQAAQNIAKPVQVAQKDVPQKNTPVPETVQPEVKNMQNAVAKIEERQIAENNAQCLRSVSDDVYRQFLQNNQEANACINNAEARFHESAYYTRYNVNQNREIFENRNQHDGEIMTTCASSQYQKCQQEENLLLKTNEDYATIVNNDLAQISDAEEILKQELTICEANAETRHAELCDEASAAKAEC